MDKIRKRDGRLEGFDPARIRDAILDAQRAVGRSDPASAEQIARSVQEELSADLQGDTPGVEQVQDVVERKLMTAGQADVAKAYILYRQRRAEARETKKVLGLRDDLKLTLNAATVLDRRYLRRDAAGQVTETPREMFERVARAIAEAEASFGGGGAVGEMGELFFDMMNTLAFLPNSPTLMNAGTEMGQLSACFVLPVPDSIDGIFTALHDMAVIHQSGGGTGFSFSRLRPRDDQILTAGGVSSGPVSFMRIFDMATEVVRQGGRRRGANMGILHVDHPDIREFVTAKADPNSLCNFNLSVAVPNAFMDAVRRNDMFPVLNPRTGERVGELRAADLFNLIVMSSWQGGDPGLVFIDRINAANPLPQLGPMEATNPCGEQPLLPYESCNLGSINLAAMLRGTTLDWDRLRETVDLAVRFLDDVIEVQRYPLPAVEEIACANRKVGLGIMGFADLLLRMGVPYASVEALAFAERLMAFITKCGREASARLAGERGAFSTFPGSRWEREGSPPLRNSTVTTVAPTGTISIIAGVSSGIEPLFALSYLRHVLEGKRLLEEHPLFVEEARHRGFYSRDMMAEIARTGSAKDIAGVPDEVKRLYACAHDIEPAWHVKMQAAFQKHTDNAVSKTVNLPTEANQNDVREVYKLAYSLGCKGITVYRYGSRTGQTLSYPGGPIELAEDEGGSCRRCAT